MVQHEMRSDSPVDAPEKPRDPCQPWRGNLSFQPQLKMRTSAPAVTAVESGGAPRDSPGESTSLRLHEQVPEVPIVTQEEPHYNSRKTKKLPLSASRGHFPLQRFKRSATFHPEPSKGP